jgi:glycosyltransferase involved in cell wall biosynthesis
MYVCHIIETAGGGSGKVVIDLARAGLAACDDVTVVYSPNRAEPSFVASLSAMPELSLVATPMRRDVGPHDFIDAWRLYRCLRVAGPFDVLHGHSSKAGAFVRILGLLFPEAIKIYTPHAFVTMAPGVSSFYGMIERVLGLLCDSVIAVSEVEKEHAVVHIGISETKIAVIPNGVHIGPCDRAAARRELGYGADELILGFVGRLLPQKNPLRVIDAFDLVRRQCPNLKLAIVGEGPLRTAIEEMITGREIENQVRCFAGKIGRNIAAGFDALVCSSDYEGFPIVFLEALAAGVPIVTTPVGGAQESVIGGQTGFIVDGFSEESLALAILKFVELDPEQKAHQSTQARMHAQQFRIETIAAKTRALYHRFNDAKKKRLEGREGFDAAS